MNNQRPRDRALQEPHKRRRLGQTAGRIVAERLSLATSLTAYQTLFNQLTVWHKTSQPAFPNNATN